MTAVTTTLTSDASDATTFVPDARTIESRRRRRWTIWGVVALVVVAGVWFGLSRGGGPTVASTVADCAQGFGDGPNPPSVTSLQPGVVGLGSVASIATFDTPTGEAWCFDGMGVGSAGITNAQMQSALSAPVAVEDGKLTSDVLLLVHLGKTTTSVVVTTADARSSVLARKNGFEVLRVPTTGWPSSHWHAPWPRRPVTLGRIIGFDNEGRVTASMPFTWCPGGINNSPGTGC
jgi:hypothetical protein